MARSIVGSIIYALEGLTHALRTELNLKIFVTAYVLSLVVSAVLRISHTDWAIMLLSGGTFLAMEMINTAIERFADAFDTHSKNQDDIHFEAIKTTKDVAAGASLIAGCTWVAVALVLLIPYLVQRTA